MGELLWSKGTVYLTPDNWDDWYEFSTYYTAVYVDKKGSRRGIGGVKIGEFGLRKMPPGDYKGERGFRKPTLEQRFDRIGEQCFSLGQDTSYYENLEEIGPEFRDEYLRAMNDIVLDLDLLARAQDEAVTRRSLLRSVPLQTVKYQFHRLALGRTKLTEYNFEFELESATGPPPVLTFAVEPESKPATNVHALIGRNGAGKSRTLNKIARNLVEGPRQEEQAGAAVAFSNELPSWRQLSNVVSVSFSAFDAFNLISDYADSTEGLAHTNVGLRKEVPDGDRGRTVVAKSREELLKDIKDSVKVCLQGARRDRWKNALTTLELDPGFEYYGLSEAVADQESGDEDDEFFERLPEIFDRMSSGHQIVLMTMTKLVETVEERSLVLIDEPESHLHPPLLSAFVRALSDLLTERNGLAVLATHSPVVLQEVPRSCVWKLYRDGDVVSAERPTIETFGENVGTLTNEVFGLDVKATGFHRELAEAVAEESDYQSALDMFGGKLGSEGLVILRAMANARNKGRDVGR